MQTKAEREYLSPDYKLIPFFRNSRDSWKRKAQRAQQRLKKAKERLKHVRARRDYWKQLAQAEASAPPPQAAPKTARRGRGRQAKPR